jgi:hypothetical protein
MNAGGMNGKLDLASVVVASADQVSCEVADETVILSLTTGEYYGLNVVAASIWELVQKPTTVRAVRDALLLMYDDVDEAICTTQVLASLAEMEDMGLVVRPA